MKRGAWDVERKGFRSYLTLPRPLRTHCGGNPSRWVVGAGPEGEITPRLLLGFAASAAVGVLAHRRGSLSRSGVVGAMLTGTTIFAGGGLAPAALLLTFFVSSSALSHRRKRRRRESMVEHAKGERRDFAQTIANGGVAAALVALGRARPASPWYPAYIGALATVNADTWATELGLFSRVAPRLITNWRVVIPGTSGGITPLGTGAAALGAALIGAVAVACATVSWRAPGRDLGMARTLVLAVAAGLGGSFVDSLLGATVQARYRCPVCGEMTERPVHRCGTPAVLIGGWRWIDNDVVNLAASACGAGIGWLVGRAGRGEGKRAGDCIRTPPAGV